MPHLPLLCEPYVRHTFAYLPDELSNANEEASKPTYKDWIQVFRHSLPIFKEHALKDEQVATSGAREAMALAFEQRFLAALNVLEHQPYLKLEGFQAQPLSCLSLCSIREVCLRQAGFHDIFAAVKSRENQAALAVLPSLLQELDGILDAKARWEQLLRGVFAGNIFDLGAAASAALYAEGSASAPAFAATRAALLTRPWAEDDLEAAVEHLAQQPGYRSAVVFVDNAGSDVVLGMLPLARELVRQGCQVLLAANALPSINDITAVELAPLLQQAGELDPQLLGRAVAQGVLRVVSSGSDLPVIDLANVGSQLCDQCAQCDLVILEGMGRAIETNLYAKFKCDSLKLGMIKHREVATCLGGRLYDCVCKFTPGQEAVTAGKTDDIMKQQSELV